MPYSGDQFLYPCPMPYCGWVITAEAGDTAEETMDNIDAAVLVHLGERHPEQVDDYKAVMEEMKADRYGL